MKVLVIQGPNLNMLGHRDPRLYGTMTLEQIHSNMKAFATQQKAPNGEDLELEFFQSNFEGEIIDKLQECVGGDYDGVIMNPGGLSHSSISIVDAIVKTGIAPSKGQARTLISQGGISLNDEKVSDINYQIAKRDDHLSHHPFDAWVPPESIHCEEGQLSIENKMKEWGDGSRAEVMVLWEGQHGSGHVFVAEQINGQTHFIDPQSGKDGVAWYFDLCDSSNIYICRTDNKDLSEHITECCY